MSKVLSYLAGFTPKFWLIVCAALLGLSVAAYFKGRGDMSDIWQGRVAKANAEAAKAQLRAERLANENDALRQAAIISNHTDRQKAIEEAVRAYPEETSRPVGPATGAVIDSLRRQTGQTGTATR